MKRIRLTLFIGIGVAGPLNLIALIVKAFVTEAGVFFLLTVIVLSLVMILTIIASIVSLIKIYRWLRESESKDSKRRIAGSIALLITTVFLGAIQISETDLPKSI